MIFLTKTLHYKNINLPKSSAKMLYNARMKVVLGTISQYPCVSALWYSSLLCDHILSASLWLPALLHSQAKQ